ncbi:hypothetical protein B0H16DRAFT_1450991 [Mycena metata]|uniref:Uncharacterized protein n=1 Tax=Mycena metata TaxID=1033252 RepID=A0AAD7JWB9_9AGAR|nr:hypothetical protein B0H16DRAFT_1450991 [Mycena metata]
MYRSEVSKMLVSGTRFLPESVRSLSGLREQHATRRVEEGVDCYGAFPEKRDSRTRTARRAGMGICSVLTGLDFPPATLKVETRAQPSSKTGYIVLRDIVLRDNSGLSMLAVLKKHFAVRESSWQFDEKILKKVQNDKEAIETAAEAMKESNEGGSGSSKIHRDRSSRRRVMRPRTLRRSAGASRDSSSDYKIVLFSGPLRIGKTTSAHMVAKLDVFTPIKLNTSGDRSLDGYIAGSCCGRVGWDVVRRSWRGGAFNALIKRSKVPIICIANDGRAQNGAVRENSDRRTIPWFLRFKKTSSESMRLKNYDGPMKFLRSIELMYGAASSISAGELVDYLTWTQAGTTLGVDAASCGMFDHLSCVSHTPLNPAIDVSGRTPSNKSRIPSREFGVITLRRRIGIGFDVKTVFFTLEKISAPTKTSLIKEYNASVHPIIFYKADAGKGPKQLPGVPAPGLNDAFLSHGYFSPSVSSGLIVAGGYLHGALQMVFKRKEHSGLYHMSESASSTASPGIIVVVGVDVERFLSKSFQIVAAAEVDLGRYLRGPHCWDGYVLHSLTHELPPLSLNMGDGFKYFAVSDSLSVPLDVLLARQRVINEKIPLGSVIYAPRLLSEFLSAPLHVNLHEFCAEPVRQATCIPYIQSGAGLDWSRTRTCDPGIDMASYLGGVHCWFLDVLYPLDCDLPPIRFTSDPSSLATHYSYADPSSIPFEVRELRFRLSDSKVPVGDPTLSGHHVPRRAKGFVPAVIHDTCLVYEFLSAPRHITYHQFQSVPRTTSFSPGVHVGMSPEVRRVLNISDRLSGVVPLIITELQTKFSELRGEVMTLAGPLSAAPADSQSSEHTSGATDSGAWSVLPPSLSDIVATGSFTTEPGIDLAKYLEGNHGWGRGVVDGVACWFLYPLDGELVALLVRQSPGGPAPHFSPVNVGCDANVNLHVGEK